MMFDAEWDKLVAYMQELWPTANFTAGELRVFRKAVEGKNLRLLKPRNFADAMDAERLTSRTHKPSFEALLDRMGEINATVGAQMGGPDTGQAWTRVRRWRHDHPGTAGWNDAQVLREIGLAWGNRFGERQGIGHLIDCAKDVMDEDGAFSLARDVFGVAGEEYVDAILRHRAECRARGDAQRAARRAKMAGGAV